MIHIGSFKYSSDYEDNYCEHIDYSCDYSSNQRDQKYSYINKYNPETL